MGWISMDEQKPQNRARVIVATLTELGKRHITIAEYIESKTVLGEDFLDPDSDNFAEYDEEKDCYWTPGGFYESQYATKVNYYLDEKVTHWMPLPAVPVEEASRAAS